jgi:hypothetical protein
LSLVLAIAFICTFNHSNASADRSAPGCTRPAADKRTQHCSGQRPRKSPFEDLRLQWKTDNTQTDQQY